MLPPRLVAPWQSPRLGVPGVDETFVVDTFCILLPSPLLVVESLIKSRYAATLAARMGTW